MPIPLLYGSLIALSQFVATLLVYAFGLHGSTEGLAKAQKPESILGFVLLMVLLGLAHRAAKKASVARGEPELPFGSAAKLAALVALVAGATTGALQWLYAAIINPSLAELQRALVVQQYGTELAKLPADASAAAMKQIELASSAPARGLIYALNTFLFALLLGIAYALIFRAAIRREQKAAKAAA